MEIPNIKDPRIIGGFGQDEVAAKSKVCRTYISLAETGRLVLKPEQYERILTAINELAQERAAAVRKACASETVIATRSEASA